MASWEVWFADGRIEPHSRSEQLSVEEMEAILGGYLDLQTVLTAGERRDMAVRWDAFERKLPVNDRATDAWRAALMARGLKSLRSEVVRGDAIVLGYSLLRRAILPIERLQAIRQAAAQAAPGASDPLDGAALELVLGELLEIDADAQRAGYRAAVQNAISQYHAMLSALKGSAVGDTSGDSDG